MSKNQQQENKNSMGVAIGLHAVNQAINIGQACQNIIDSIRADWTERAKLQFLNRGFKEDAAKTAAENLWKTGDIDTEPEIAVDDYLTGN